MSVLIVDHHAAFRYYLGLYLGLLDRGYAVVGEADSAAAALALIAAAPPDLVFTDIELPDHNGLRLTREVRRAWPGVAVIVLSNNAAAEYRQAALDAGASDYVDKLEVVQALPAVLHALGAPAAAPARPLPGAARPATAATAEGARA
ncbi:MAG TPA: response regulator transcription factor [Thermomicrobiales bacterium]|nr:response regulator transcription factor [Thermomicrobiales bacterium]